MTDAAANRPLPLIAIDPSMTHTGMAHVIVRGFRHLDIVASTTINNPPRRGTKRTDEPLPFPERIQRLVDGVREFVQDCAFEATAPSAVTYTPTWVICEEPTFATMDRNRRNAPKTTGTLFAGYGAVMAALVSVFRAANLDVVPVTRWYPRAGKGMMGKADVLKMIRGRYPGFKGNEHETMAVGLALWWSEHCAPRIWHDQQSTGRLAL